MPTMYPPRAKRLALNIHISQVPAMIARGWSFEPLSETQRVEPPAKLTAAERAELRGVLAEALAETGKLTGDQRAAIRQGAAYEPPKPKRKRKQGKDKET